MDCEPRITVISVYNCTRRTRDQLKLKYRSLNFILEHISLPMPYSTGLEAAKAREKAQWHSTTEFTMGKKKGKEKKALMSLISCIIFDNNVDIMYFKYERSKNLNYACNLLHVCFM